MNRDGNNAVHGASTSQCNAAPKSREIPERLDTLFTLSEILSERLARLNSRLNPVLVMRPCELDQGKERRPSTTTMGDQLAQIATRLELVIFTVDAMDSALEL